MAYGSVGESIILTPFLCGWRKCKCFLRKQNCKKWVSCYHSFARDKYFREHSPESCYDLGSMQRISPNLAHFHDMSVLPMTLQVSHLFPQLLCAPAPSQDSFFLLCTQTRWFHSEPKGTSCSKAGVRLLGLSSYNVQDQWLIAGVLVQGSGCLMFSSTALVQGFPFSVRLHTAEIWILQFWC